MKDNTDILGNETMLQMFKLECEESFNMDAYTSQHVDIFCHFTIKSAFTYNIKCVNADFIKPYWKMKFTRQ